MLPRKRLVTHLLLLPIATVLTSAADDAQVIRSPRSVLTIYTYGSGQGLRFAPELPEPKPRTAALTDVVASPPLSSSVSGWTRRPSVKAHRNMATPTTATAPKRAAAISRETSAQSSLTMVPTGPGVVFLEWQPSPDQSVVGYNLYMGDASHQYTTKQPLGNQMIAQLPIDQRTIYVAISAYTVEGLESRLSEELIIPPTPTQGISTTSSVIGVPAGSQ
jgi:hypothetical protein